MTGLVEVASRGLAESETAPELAGGAGGLLHARDTHPRTGRLLSLAELQRALQVARDASPIAAERQAVDRPDRGAALLLDVHQATPAAATPAATPAMALQAPLCTGRGSPNAVRAEAGRPVSTPAEWTPDHCADVVVLGVHGGSGASTVALALADAAAVSRPVHLVSGHTPPGCGLLAVPHVELGSGGPGWRRGRRGNRVLVDRAGGQQPAAGWPSLPVPDGALTVLDSAPGAALDLPPAAVVVLVCHPTVPGVQRTEHALRQLFDTALADGPADGEVDLDIIVSRACLSAPRAVLLACVGPARWPGEVTATAGVHLQRLQRDGRVVPVPLDRHLAVTGPCSGPLPKGVLKAGGALLQLVDADLAARATYRTAAHPDVCPPRPVVSSPDPDPKDRCWR